MTRQTILNKPNPIHNSNKRWGGLRAKTSWLQSARDQQRVQTYEVASRAGSSDLWTLGAKRRPNLRTHLDLNALVFKAQDLELKKTRKNIRKMNKKRQQHLRRGTSLSGGSNNLPPLAQNRQFHPNKRHSVTLQISLLFCDIIWMK